MRISDVGNFVTCEAMALQDKPPSKSMSAAAMVGTMAHAYVSGQTRVDVPEIIRWDNVTPTKRVALAQAGSIADKVEHLLEQSDLHVRALEYEVDVVTHLPIHIGPDDNPYDTGRIDIMGVCDVGGVVLDLKTGRDIGAGWLQLGGYLSSFDTYVEAARGGILHVPRMAIGKDQAGTLEIRDREDLVYLWDIQRSRIDDVTCHGHDPMRSPGSHCKYCAVADCAVRATPSIYAS